jgi:4-amino-4-deoxy-L-arabinose transferase-like glycosyltransferase
MLLSLGAYAIVALVTAAGSDWIGHADYAENAVVARSFVEGRGLTVDYVAQFYSPHPGITHPAETWPLLQPLMIAPYFVPFGAQTWAAKLPNIFVMLGLAWLVYSVASRLWDRRVGLLAGLLTLAHPYFFNSAIYPINDLPFTTIFFALAWLVWRRLAPYTLGDEEEVSKGSGVANRLSRLLASPLLIGALAGLLVWCKPSGVILLAGLGLWAVWTWLREWRPRRVKVPWRDLGIAAAVAGIALLPLVLRNLLAFGQPYYTTESLDAWLLRYWPLRDWEYIYSVYPASDMPNWRWVVGGKYGYQNIWEAFLLNVRWIWDRGILTPPGDGEHVLGLLPLGVAALGLAGLTRRTANLFGLVAAAIGLYTAFILIYWHFEGRYFQVAVPWLLMLAAWGVFWTWDRLREGLREGTGRRWGLLALPVAVGALLITSVPVIVRQAELEVRPTGFVETMRWLEANSTPDDVVMTRDPWELNWYTRRRAVMIPFNDLATIRDVARRYGVTMLQLGGPVDRVDVGACPDGDMPQERYPTGSRPALGSLYCGGEIPGFRLVYQDRGGTIYRLTGEGP